MSADQITTVPAFVCRSIDSVNEWIGRCISWLVAVMVAVVSAVVLLRAVLDIGSVAAQELVTYLHAALFMLCLAYTLKEDGHVRVDVFYRRMSTTNRAWVNALGSVLCLLPFSFFLIFISWDFVTRSWEIGEISGDAGGLAVVYALKSLIPLAAVLLALQGLGEIARNLLVLTWRETSADDAC